MRFFMNKGKWLHKRLNGAIRELTKRGVYDG